MKINKNIIFLSIASILAISIYAGYESTKDNDAPIIQDTPDIPEKIVETEEVTKTLLIDTTIETEYGKKIRYLETAHKDASGEEWVIVETIIETRTGQTTAFELKKISETILSEEDGWKVIQIGGTTKGETVTLNLIIDEYEDDRTVRYIEKDDGEIFRQFAKPENYVYDGGELRVLDFDYTFRDGLEKTYKKIDVADEKNKSLVIIPTFTASAYSEPGFYSFYRGECDMELHGTLFRDDDCLTVNILSENKFSYQSSSNAVKILTLLGYESITDMELHTNPNILKNYEKIILLHNEYVSRIMFDAITSHDNVIFLYPNALYAEIEVNIVDNTITLIRGHNYPDILITNGFDWKNENTHPFEYDNECKNWEFYATDGEPNGFMLNCYPENIIWKDESLLQTLKDL